jgi:hypothetical protein
MFASLAPLEAVFRRGGLLLGPPAWHGPTQPRGRPAASYLSTSARMMLLLRHSNVASIALRFHGSESKAFGEYASGGDDSGPAPRIVSHRGPIA